MKKLYGMDPKSRSQNLVAENIVRLKRMFPEVVTEGPGGAALNLDVLKDLVGDQAVTDCDEKYGLSWHGKRRARRLALTPSAGTLRPRPEESVDWETTQNLMIEGDNLEVLKLLQKSYAGKVKLIYIDPPYNTGKDFVYPDSFQDSISNYLELTGQVKSGAKISSSAETSGRFHTDWLNMIYPRIKLARYLLRDDGVILVSIDDGEVDRLKLLMSEIFGEENFLAVLIWNKQHSQQQGLFKRYHEYVVGFAKRAEAIENIRGGEGEIDAGALKKASRANPPSNYTFPAGVRFDADDGLELNGTYGGSEKVEVVSGRLRSAAGKTAEQVTLRAGWTQRNQMDSWFAGQETFDTKGQKVLEFYFNSAGKLKCRKERSAVTPPSILPKYGMVSTQTEYVSKLMGKPVFSTPKPVDMLDDFLRWFVEEGDIALDFFAGSGTLGEAVFRSGLEGRGGQFLLVQLPEPIDPEKDDEKPGAQLCDTLGKPRNIAELTKERLRRSAQKIREEHPLYEGDLGFRVFKLDSSNIRAWDPDPDDLDQTLLDSIEHLKEGRTEIDVLYELLLKLGLDLCVPIEKRTIAGKEVHSVDRGVLFACLTESITADDVEDLAQGLVEWHDELEPAGDVTCVFRDWAFADDVAKTNMAAILEQHGVENVRSL